MKKARTAAFLLVLLYLCFFGCLAFTISSLPQRVATHFDARGHANDSMSVSGYLRFMTVFGLGFPLLVPAICYLSRFLPPQLHNIPHRDYWLDPARRGEFFDYLLRHSLWFASMALVFVIGIHLSIVQANSSAQVHLSVVLILTVAGAFLAGTAIWGATLFRRLNCVA
jgi:uncharacterized membrane protein